VGDTIEFRAEHIIDIEIDVDESNPCDCHPQDLVDCDLIEYGPCGCDERSVDDTS